MTNATRFQKTTHGRYLAASGQTQNASNRVVHSSRTRVEVATPRYNLFRAQASRTFTFNDDRNQR